MNCSAKRRNAIKLNNNLVQTRVFQTFFLITPFREFKKAIVTLKHLRPFFFALYLQLKNIQYKFQSFKIAQIKNKTPFTPLLIIAPNLLSSPPFGKHQFRLRFYLYFNMLDINLIEKRVIFHLFTKILKKKKIKS